MPYLHCKANICDPICKNPTQSYIWDSNTTATAFTDVYICPLKMFSASHDFNKWITYDYVKCSFILTCNKCRIYTVKLTFVTRFAKTRHNHIFGISRNAVFKYLRCCSFLMPQWMDAKFTV